MEASKTVNTRVPVRSARVAADFLLLAAASVVAGLMVAAGAAALVILLSASANAQTWDAMALANGGPGAVMLKTGKD